MAHGAMRLSKGRISQRPKASGSVYKATYDRVNREEAALIHHQGIISPPRRDLVSGVAFPPEAGKRSFLLAEYCSIRLSRRSSAPCI